MRPTLHAIIALAMLACGATLAVPQIANIGADRAIPVDKLTVPPDRARPSLTTADHALGAVVQAQAGMPMGNPFALRERGRLAQLPVPEPPPPSLTLPDPPPTPFAPAAR